MRQRFAPITAALLAGAVISGCNTSALDKTNSAPGASGPSSPTGPGQSSGNGGAGGGSGPAVSPGVSFQPPIAPAPSGAPGTPAPTTVPPLPVMPPAANTGDQYQNPGTNPFVVTTHDPFSTFAVDVDTASYDILRRDVNLGILPAPPGVRLEEYVNAFPYDYPAPAPGDPHPFRVSLAAAEQVFDRPTTLFRVGVQARKPPPFEKKAANLVFLVDVSGSMASSDKLPLVKTLLLLTLDRLAPEDKVTIVTYAGTTAVRLPPTAVSERARIAEVIQSLQAGGSTAGAAALDLAYQQASAGFLEGGINHILMCTDGDFNVGPSSTPELLRIIRERRQTGVTLTVLGFGIGNLNDSLMETVADAGNGIYGVISSEENARMYVAERLLSTLVHVAKDMKIQVEFNPTLVRAYRLLGFENRAIADSDFRNDLIDAGEIGAGHRVTALYELVMADASIPTAQGAPAAKDGPPSDLPREIAGTDLALVKVRYKRVEANPADPALETTQTLPANDVSEGLAVADPDLQWAVAVAALAEILKKSPYADAAFLPAITRIVDAQRARDPDRAELGQLLTKLRTLLGTP